MKSLKSFPVPSPCSDLLFIVNKRILKYSAKSTSPFHGGSQCSAWLCVPVLGINNDVKPIVIKEVCLLNSKAVLPLTSWNLFIMIFMSFPPYSSGFI